MSNWEQEIKHPISKKDYGKSSNQVRIEVHMSRPEKEHFKTIIAETGQSLSEYFKLAAYEKIKRETKQDY